MKYLTFILTLIISFNRVNAQRLDTVLLRHPISKYDTVIYQRIIERSRNDSLIHVRDYFPNGKIQMDAYYLKLDESIKEELQCNYRTNKKHGPYREWFDNGQLSYSATYRNGLRNGLGMSWYKTGIKESEKNWKNGQLNGNCKYWNEKGDLDYELTFENGINQNPRSTTYNYIYYLPHEYPTDSTKSFPLLIFLHGGSARGNDTLDLYASGPFDQIHRGRNFPFIVAAPQCPKHLRWSTENWFNNFYEDLTTKYRIDTNRIYLTGESLGGSGTWYLAAKYPDRFAAIAPISGFTTHMDYLSNNVENFSNIRIWAFHGDHDTVVPVEETEFLVKKIQNMNNKILFTKGQSIGHWIHWLVYPEDELYQWLLQF